VNDGKMISECFVFENLSRSDAISPPK